MKQNHYPEKRKCPNPKCRGVYSVDAKGIIVEMCPCLTRLNIALSRVNIALSRDLAKIGKVITK